MGPDDRGSLASDSGSALQALLPRPDFLVFAEILGNHSPVRPSREDVAAPCVACLSVSRRAKSAGSSRGRGDGDLLL
jgi:hypothetical protein